MTDNSARDVMAREVICISPSTTLDEAFGMIAELGIHHLPVLDHHALVGIVSDRDLLPLCDYDETGELSLQSDRPVRELMTTELITAHPSATVGELARTMLLQGIDALPIVAEGELVGLVTTRDLLGLLVGQRASEAAGAALPFEFTIRHVSDEAAAP